MQFKEESIGLGESSSLKIRKEKQKGLFRTIRRQVVQKALETEMNQGMYLKYTEFKDQNILARNVDTLLEATTDLNQIQTILRFLRKVSADSSLKILKFLGEEGQERLFQLVMKLVNNYGSIKILMIDSIWLLVNLTTHIDRITLQNFLVNYGPLKAFRKLLNIKKDEDYPLLFQIVRKNKHQIVHFYANVAGFGRTFIEMVLDVDIIDLVKDIKQQHNSLYKEKIQIIFFLFHNLAPQLNYGFISQCKFVTKCAVECLTNDQIHQSLRIDAFYVLDSTTNQKYCIKIAKEEYIEQNIISWLRNAEEGSDRIEPCLSVICNFTCYFNDNYFYQEKDLPLLLMNHFQNQDYKIDIRSLAGLALCNLCGNENRTNEITQIAEQEYIEAGILDLLHPENQPKILKLASQLVYQMLNYGLEQIGVNFMHLGILHRICQVLLTKSKQHINRFALQAISKACENPDVLILPGVRDIQREISQNLDLLEEIAQKDQTKLVLLMKVTETLGLRRGDDEEIKDEEEFKEGERIFL